MLVSTDLVASIAVAVGLLIGASIEFGHRYRDRGASLLEKPKADELAEIRLGMRDEETMPILEKLWEFLNRTNQELRKTNREMKVSELSLDTGRRGKFNDLINDLFQSFKGEIEIKQSLEDLTREYSHLGGALYSIAGIAGFGSYSILILSLTNWLDPVGSGGFIIALTCSILGIYIVVLLKRVGRKLKVYQDAMKKYLLEVPKLR